MIAGERDWGSTAWFYNSQGSNDTKNKIRTGGKTGRQSSLTDCVQTTVDGGSGDQSPVAYWEREAKALGIATD